MIKEIVALMTDDGMIFTDVKAAQEHQKLLDFDAWYEDHQLYGLYAGSRVTAEDMKTWLTENRASIIKFLGGEVK